MRRRDDGAFPVFEAVLVAMFIFAAMLFLAALERPTADQSSRGSDLSRTAQQTLDILEVVNLTVGGQDLPFETWMTRLLAGDAAVEAELDAFMRDFLSPGVRYALRVDNGIEPIHLAPSGPRPIPTAGRVAGSVLFANWTAFHDRTIEFVVAPGEPMPLFDPCDGTTDWTDVRAASNWTTGPDGTPWATWWCANTQGGLAPAAAPLGPWRYTGEGCASPCYFMVSLNGAGTWHPVMAVQLVMWHAA